MMMMIIIIKARFDLIVLKGLNQAVHWMYLPVFDSDLCDTRLSMARSSIKVNSFASQHYRDVPLSEMLHNELGVDLDHQSS